MVRHNAQICLLLVTGALLCACGLLLFGAVLDCAASASDCDLSQRRRMGGSSDRECGTVPAQSDDSCSVAAIGESSLVGRSQMLTTLTPSIVSDLTAIGVSSDGSPQTQNSGNFLLRAAGQPVQAILCIWRS